jgi:hypothetical protein
MQKIFLAALPAIVLTLSLESAADVVQNPCLTAGAATESGCMDLSSAGSATAGQDAFYYVPTASSGGDMGGVDAASSAGQGTPGGGYSRHTSFDPDKNAGVFTQVIAVADLLSQEGVVVDGVDYVELLFDLDLPGRSAYLELTALQIFSTDTPPPPGALNGLGSPFWDLDAVDDSLIQLNHDKFAAAGHSDLLFLLPKSALLGSGDYLVLFNQFNGYNGARGGISRNANCTASGARGTATCVDIAQVSEVPVPGTLALLGLGLTGLLARLRRR